MTGGVVALLCRRLAMPAVDNAGGPGHNCAHPRQAPPGPAYPTLPSAIGVCAGAAPRSAPFREVETVPDLNNAEVLALAKASRIAIPEDLLPEVRESLNGLLAALDAIAEPDVAAIEPLPIILSPTARRVEAS